MQNKGNISTKVKKHIQETLRLTCLWLQQLFCYSTILYFTHRTAYYIETGCCVHGTVHSFILLLTLSNHYYGKSFYMLPNQTKRYRCKYIYTFHGGCVVRETQTAALLQHHTVLYHTVWPSTLIDTIDHSWVTYWHRWTSWAPAFLSGHDVACMSDSSPPLSSGKYIHTLQRRLCWGGRGTRGEREKEERTSS